MSELWSDEKGRKALERVLAGSDGSGQCSSCHQMFSSDDLWLLEQLIDRGYLVEPFGRKRVLKTGLPIALRLTSSAHDFLKEKQKSSLANKRAQDVLGLVAKYVLLPAAAAIVAAIILYYLNLQS